MFASFSTFRRKFQSIKLMAPARSCKRYSRTLKIIIIIEKSQTATEKKSEERKKNAHTFTNENTKKEIHHSKL